MKLYFLPTITIALFLTAQCTSSDAENSTETSTNASDNPSETIEIGSPLSEEQLTLIEDLKTELKQPNSEALCARFDYPFYRKATEDTIIDASFMNFHILNFFEDEYRNEVIASSKAKWHANAAGELYYKQKEFVLSPDGKFLELNHLNLLDKTKIAKKEAIEIERMSLHDSLKNFLEPELTATTENYQIRIDRMEDNTFRFASWPVGAEMSSYPTVLIDSGHYVAEGYGGNHSFHFTKGAHRYVYSANKLGDKSIPIGYLSIYSGENEILHENAIPPSLEDFWNEFLEHDNDRVYLAQHVHFHGNKEVTYDEFKRNDFDLGTFAEIKRMSYGPTFAKFDWDKTVDIYKFITANVYSSHIYSVRCEPDYTYGNKVYFMLDHDTYYFIGYHTYDDPDFYYH